MVKAKLLMIFTGIIAALAVSAAPALAEFESTTGKATGAVKSGPVVIEGGGATLECTSAEGSGTTLFGGKEALKGAILSILVKKWDGCKVKTKEFKELTPELGECTIHLLQGTGETTAKASVFGKECLVSVTILFFKCTIHVVVENKIKNVNLELQKNLLENSYPNLIIYADDTGITTFISGVCSGIADTKEGKLKATVTDEGLREV
jgi:hypothetical protein